MLHGSRQDGAAHRRFTGGMYDALAEDGRAVVAYLDGYRGNWNDAREQSRFPARTEDVDDVAFVRAVVDDVVRRWGADPGRVVVTGYSNGGQMVLRLLHECPDLFSGAAAGHVDRTEYAAPGHAPVTLLTLHGAGHTVPGPRSAPRIMGRTSHEVSMADEVALLLGIGRRGPAGRAEDVPA